MRLRKIRDLLKEYGTKFEYTERKLNNTGEHEVEGLQQVINAINKLAPLGFLENDIERLKRYDTVYYSKSVDDKMILPQNVTTDVRRIVTTVKEKVQGFQKLINNSIPEQEENVVSVKLPDYEELEDLSKFFKNLNTALKSGLVNKEIQGNYRLQNFDTGSLWIDLALAAGALKFFGDLVTTALNVKKQSYQLQMTKKNVEILDLKQEHLKAVNEAFENHLSVVVESEVKALNGENRFDPETLESMKLSVRLLSELMIEGTEFHPPLNAPEEVTEAFPEPPKPTYLSEPQGLLEQLASDLTNEESNE